MLPWSRSSKRIDPTHVNLQLLVFRNEERRQKWITCCEASDLISKNGSAYEAILKLPVDEKLAYKVSIDLARTKMSEPAANEEWKSSLKNILTAFAQLDPETYYVQGMNFLAAELLEILSEEEAFWVFVQLMKRFHFRDCFRRGMIGLPPLFERLTSALARHDPALAAHFDEECLLPNTYGVKWFITLFTCKIPPPKSHLILDLFLQRGWDAILHIGLAFLILNREPMLKMPIEDMQVALEDYPNQTDFDEVLALASKTLSADIASGIPSLTKLVEDT